MAVKQSTIDKYVGKIFPSAYDGDMEIIEVLGAGKCKVKFLNNDNVKETWIKSVTDGEVRDLERRPIYKVGVMDTKGYLKKGTPKPKDYSVWNGMIQRCYNENTRSTLMTYKDVEVSDDFKMFSKFKVWYEQQIGYDQEGWHLDKDVLSLDNKVYSAETCVLIPPDINCLITNNKSVRGELPVGVTYNCTKTRYRARIQKQTGWVSLGTYDHPEEAFLAYKQAKEDYIKDVAEKWKGDIDIRVYNALMNWEININD